MSQDDTSRTNETPAPFPICELNATMHFKDFVPSDEALSHLNFMGFYN
jgi:hypothetical protein